MNKLLFLLLSSSLLFSSDSPPPPSDMTANQDFSSYGFRQKIWDFVRGHKAELFSELQSDTFTLESGNVDHEHRMERAMLGAVKDSDPKSLALLLQRSNEAKLNIGSTCKNRVFEFALIYLKSALNLLKEASKLSSENTCEQEISDLEESFDTLKNSKRN